VFNRGPVFTTEYEAILNKATALGYTKPSADQQIKQNTLLLTLKTSGVWDEWDVFYMFANNGSKEFATLNWKNPDTNQNTLVNSPTFTSNQGFQGNGTSSYINVNYNPQSSGTHYAKDNASSGFWSELLTHDGNYLYSGSSSYFRDISATLFRNAINDGDGTNRTSPAGEVKFFHSSRSNSTTKNMFENGSALGPYTMSSTTEASNFELLRGFGAYSSSKISCFYCGSNLESKVSDIYTALNTYMTSL